MVERLTGEVRSADGERDVATGTPAKEVFGGAAQRFVGPGRADERNAKGHAVGADPSRYGYVGEIEQADEIGLVTEPGVEREWFGRGT